MDTKAIKALAISCGMQPPETYHGDPESDTPWLASTQELEAFAAAIEARLIEAIDKEFF